MLIAVLAVAAMTLASVTGPGLVHPALAQTGTPTDRDILVALYNATDGPNWKNNTNWNSNASIGEWYGVSTNSDGRVVALSLHQNQLTGAIPAQLGSLTNLTWLNLDRNQLTGTIPLELGSLTSLERLSLYDNQLTGAIPTQLGNLTSPCRACPRADGGKPAK